jgi:plasmid maintenance system antidote protein VapI
VTLGEWLQAAGLRKADLATAASLRWQTVHSIVRGTQPTARTARRLARSAAQLVEERGLAVQPITAAEILGLEETAA